ncbi:MAG: response regulator [Clostridium sp.]|nr:response regulator [Clostridium sp.]
MNKHFLIYLLQLSLLTAVSLPVSGTTDFNDARLLTTANGLFNNQTRLLYEMPDGRILAYTEGMFNLYNGNSFEPLDCDLRRAYPLGMHNSCRIYTDNNGLLWAKDFYHLYLLDPHTCRFLPDLSERLAAGEVTDPLYDFCIDNDGQAWLLTQTGNVYRYNWQEKARLVCTLSEQERKTGIRVADVIQAGAFHLIIYNTGRVDCWDEKNGLIVGSHQIPSTPKPSTYFRVCSLPLDSHRLLIAFNAETGELFTYDTYRHTHEKVMDGHIINDMKRDATGTVWLGCNDALLTLSPDDLSVCKQQLNIYWNQQQITDNVMCLLFDRNASLWAGLGTSGVVHALNGPRIARTYTNTAAANQSGLLIRNLQQEDDTHLLVGTLGGIYRFDRINHRFSVLSPDTKDMFCTGIVTDANQCHWFATRQGLVRWSEGHATVYNRQRCPELPSDIIRFCLPMENGNILVCNELKHLGIFDPRTERFRFPGSAEQFDSYRALSCAIETSRQGIFVVSSQNGIFEWDSRNGRITPVEWLDSMSRFSQKYNCMYKDSTGCIWLGTQNGLIRYSPPERTLQRYTTADGLPNNCIQGIAEENNRYLWITTSDGVARFNLTAGHPALTKLNALDGLPESEMMEQSIVMTNDILYCGNATGLVEVDPRAINQFNRTLKPLIVGLRINGTSVSDDGRFNDRLLTDCGLSNARSIKLNYRENFIELNFSALNYDYPQHTRYRYRMTGIDKDWNLSTSHTGLCTASYTSMEPGTYTFIAQAAGGESDWGEELQWSIVIRPPLWKTWWAYLIYAISAIALVYYIIDAYIAIRKSRLERDQEAEEHIREQNLNQLKFRFFTNISHEFRTPLTLIITPLEVIIRRTSDPKLHKDLSGILSSAKDLLRLVNKLLDFRRLEQQGEHLTLEPVSIKSYIKENVRLFDGLAQEKHISFTCDCQFTDDDLFYLDREKITRVINNLLSNAFKFTPTGGMISVSAGWQHDESHSPTGISLSVSDTGIGIEPADLENIFDRFYQSSTSGTHGTELNTGSGIGLHLTKGYTELHHGTIHVESHPGQGSTFTVFLPVQQVEDNIPIEIPQPQPHEHQPDTDSVPDHTQAHDEINIPTTHARTNITILVAEDNAAFRRFLRETLENHYRVITAADSVEGLDKARNENPDLIISDMMMPRMDGHKFCRLIKTDVKYSHIPFILLTAKNSSESRTSSYEAGADSFIAKPFDMEVLLVRIRQLLDRRLKSKNRFHHELNVDPKEIAATDIDQQLIERAMKFVEQNIGNTDYGVENLSADIGIERTYLYRKLQAILGQSPSEFIRSVRLKRAAHMLENGNMPVQQVSYKVGFNVPRYFSAHFKEMFGVTPSQYTQMKRKEKAPKEQAE